MVMSELTGIAADGKLEQAARLIKQQLETGPQPAKTLFDLARTPGISEKSMRRAAEMLDVVKMQEWPTASSGGPGVCPIRPQRRRPSSPERKPGPFPQRWAVGGRGHQRLLVLNHGP